MDEKKCSVIITEPLVSVIVPVYHVSDNLLQKCITSILKQTYRNFEVILVDDATNETNKKIIQQYAFTHENVKAVTHQINKGLFQARLTGVKASCADYIMFVDADDYITVDWIRLLVDKSENEKSDITMGQFISIDENGNKTIYNATYNYCHNRKCLCGKEILKVLAEDEGLFFGLHTMWNKLYTMKLWKKAMPFLEKYDKHFVMTEDIALSFVLFLFADKMAFSSHDGYFYYRNSESSTVSARQHNLEKAKKNVEDLIYSFSIVNDLLVKFDLLKEYKGNIQEWKDRYFRIWSYNVKFNTENPLNCEQAELKDRFLKYFNKTEFEECREDDSFCTNETTAWNSRLETLKELICSDDIKIVSLDIFDTLILRPLLAPEEIYDLIQWEQSLSIKQHFRTFRVFAEKYARKEASVKSSGKEDITLADIYREMERSFGIPHDDCVFLYEAELNLEKDMASERKIGKEIYELSAYLGKDIILLSDMYLERTTVEQILRDNGYDKHRKLYLSSDCKKLKATGKLFDYMLKSENVLSPNTILHIGDNWNSDYLVPKSKGIQAYFLPKTKDILFNTLGDQYTGNSIGYAVDNRNSFIDLSTHLKKFPVRCLYKLVANEMFDNPFCSFKPDSDYNCDPYFIGMFPVGMHMFGIAKWMLEHSEKRGIQKIHFTSRDGFYLKKVYDQLREKCYVNAPESNYIYVSRKSMIPFEIESELDILGILDNISWSKQSPISIMDTYEAVLRPLDKEAVSKYKKEGICLDDNFASADDCLFFLKQMSRISYSKEKAEKNRKLCSRYFKTYIGPSDAIFDLGYSGKLQASIVKALGFPIDCYYVHGNGFESIKRAQKYNFNIYNFYSFAPSMSGIINEFIFSDYRPSCIGYKSSDSEVIPVFEKTSFSAVEKYIHDEISRGTLDYAFAVSNFLKEHKSLLELESLDTGLQYEKFLMSEKYADRVFFKCFHLEDQYYGDKNKINMLGLWDWQLLDKKVHANLPLVPIDNNQLEFYQDGVFMTLYNKINKWFPIKSKKRELVKKIASVFLGKKCE
ncbi:MAG: glycosyltransferase [Lachnospiraceae bacterium]|nr:glycosyltransferase [Lachnospiraceae bacterium]MCM1238726.1 glycosyltransferase [Lachnospiraceae bacterium]